MNIIQPGINTKDNHTEYLDDFNKEKKNTIKIAKQLCYSKRQIDMLREATSKYELTRLMKSFRNGMCK